MKMTIAASFTLYNIIQNILVEKLEDGTEKEREFPFDVKYKLQRNKAVLQPDAESFNAKRIELIRELGTENKENNTIKITEDRLSEFKDRITEFAGNQVEHELLKLSINDVETIKIPYTSGVEMDLFMSTMVDDPELYDTLEIETSTEVETTDEKGNS